MGETGTAMKLSILVARWVLIASVLISSSVVAQDDEERESAPPAMNSDPMTAERLGELIVRVDENARSEESTWAFTLVGLNVIVVYDMAADRMRILIPIGPAEDIPQEELLRMMQANFDSALDARYAIANGQLWGTFIHPLSELSDDEFLVGLAQTANVVLSYGTSYSSGLFTFGGGDSAEMQRELIEELRKKRT